METCLDVQLQGQGPTLPVQDRCARGISKLWKSLSRKHMGPSFLKRKESFSDSTRESNRLPETFDSVQGRASHKDSTIGAKVTMDIV